jgi:hypothetical protein
LSSWLHGSYRAASSIVCRIGLFFSLVFFARIAFSVQCSRIPPCLVQSPATHCERWRQPGVRHTPLPPCFVQSPRWTARAAGLVAVTKREKKKLVCLKMPPPKWRPLHRAAVKGDVKELDRARAAPSFEVGCTAGSLHPSYLCVPSCSLVFDIKNGVLLH